MSDDIKTLNIPLNRILKTNELSNIIMDAVKRSNKTVIHSYQFLRLWLLSKYHLNEPIPMIESGTFKTSFKVLYNNSINKLNEEEEEKEEPQNKVSENSKKKKIQNTTKNNDEEEPQNKISKNKKNNDEENIQEPQNKRKNDDLYNELCTFYNENYKPLYKINDVNTKNLSRTMDYNAFDMITNFENNIKMHYKKHLKNFLFKYFLHKRQNEYIDLQKKEQTIKKKEIKTSISELMKNILENGNDVNEYYKEWLTNNRFNVVPKDNLDIDYELKNNCQIFLKPMIYMNIELEKIECKTLQIFPLRTSVIPKFIRLDTHSLIDLSYHIVDNKSTKTELFKNITENKVEQWTNHFNLNHKIFKSKKYSFDYTIMTDGYTVSVPLVRNDVLVKKDAMKIIKTKALRDSVKLSKTDRLKKKEDKNKKKNDMQKAQHDKNKAERDKFKFEKKHKVTKEMSKEEKDKIKELNNQIRLNNEEKKKQRDLLYKKKVEFPYITDLTDEELNMLKQKNLIWVDPGKKSLVTMMDSTGKKFRYTNQEHIQHTKTKKYAEKNKKYRDATGITELESQLSDYNSKSCNIVKFKEYIGKKNEINELLYEKYAEERFRRYNFYTYINKKRSLDNLVNKIRNVFTDKDKVSDTIIYGDWSAKHQMKNNVSTPGISLKRKIAKRFTVYNIDEYNTSIISNKTMARCEHLHLNIFNKKANKNEFRELYSVLTYKMENSRLGCIHRDFNSVLNMKYITTEWLDKRKRPDVFSRKKD